MARTIVKQATTSAWDAGGASLGTQAGDLLATFTVPASLSGVLCGLAPSAVTTGVYAAVEHGVLFTAGEPVKIVESGAVVATSTLMSSAGASVMIRRIGTSVTYYLPGWSYTSANPSTGIKALDAVLYGFNDLVDNPLLVATKSLAASSSWGWAAPSVPSRLQSRGTFDWPGRVRMYSNGGELDSGTAKVGDKYELSSSNAVIVEPVKFVDVYLPVREYLGATADAVQFTDTMTARVALQALLQDFLILGSRTDATMVLLAALGSTAYLSDSTSTYAKELLQYATNLQSGAVGRYQGFDFDGFCRIGSDTYGFKKDGLYRLGGDTDNGALLSAFVEFAAENFGTAQGKRLSNVYLGLDTDGQVFLRMVDDNDVSVVYRALPRKTEYRVDTQQGNTSRYWRMRLEISDASTVTLDNIEWVVAATGRRTTS